MRFFLILFCTFIVSRSIAPEIHPFVVIWDIGQGQWITVVTNNVCIHFDMGGEWLPHDSRLRPPHDPRLRPRYHDHRTPPVMKFCSDKSNRVYLSHSDMDHIKFLAWGEAHLPHLCDAAPPLDAMDAKKRAIIARVPRCHSLLPTREVNVVEITPRFKLLKFTGHNDFSRIFVIYGPNRAILIPGDSEARAERIWSSRLYNLPPVQILVAGHHGSKTSTSEALLRALPDLKIAIASARKARYGHPDPIIVARLLTDGVPLLRTEIWGNIALQL